MLIPGSAGPDLERWLVRVGDGRRYVGRRQRERHGAAPDQHYGRTGERVVMLAGQPVTIDYSASQGNLFSLSVSNLSLNIDNIVTVEGTISYSTFTTRRTTSRARTSPARGSRCSSATVPRSCPTAIRTRWPSASRSPARRSSLFTDGRQLRAERHRHGPARRHRRRDGVGPGDDPRQHIPRFSPTTRSRCPGAAGSRCRSSSPRPQMADRSVLLGRRRLASTSTSSVRR